MIAWVPPWRRGAAVGTCGRCSLRVVASTLRDDECVQCRSVADRPAEIARGQAAEAAQLALEVA